MERRIPLLIGAAVLLGLAIDARVTAQMRTEPPPPPPDAPERLGVPPDLERLLDLTEQQKAAVAQLRKEQREAVRPLLEEQRGLREQLEKTLDAESPDAQAVGQAAIAEHGARQRVKQTNDGFRQRLLELLDAEQRQRLESFGETRGRGPGPRAGRRAPQR